jgi:hypothetical protein
MQTGALPDLGPYAPFADRFYNEVMPRVLMRRLNENPAKVDMQDIATRYNGDYVIPLPDAHGEPQFPALAAAIVADTIETAATRANDTDPQIRAPAASGKGADNRALRRRSAWYGVWHDSHLPLKLGRAYRHHFGFGQACFLVEPDFATHKPRIYTRSPLYAYPEPMEPDEVRRPNDIAFIYGYSVEMLLAKFGDTPALRRFIANSKSPEDDLFDVVEWWDNEYFYVAVLGIRPKEALYSTGVTYYSLERPLDHAFLISAGVNRVGHVPIVCGNQITLDRQISSLRRILPIGDLSNKLAALEFLAVEKAVIPDRYVIGAENRTPRIVSGRWEDGRTGKVNILQDVQAVGELRSITGPMTQPFQSNLERIQRLSTGTSSVFSGENSGAIRSGQTLSQLQAASIDPRMKEAHRIFGYMLAEINESVAETAKAYFPRRKYTVFTGLSGDDEHVEYRPVDIWDESTENSVTYPMPGMDSVNATLAAGNLVSSGLIGRRTAREKHPDIPDPDTAEREVLMEEVRAAVLTGLQQGAVSGTLAMEDLAYIVKRIDEGDKLEEAVEKAQKKAQERQAQMAPEPGMDQMTAPEAQPGLNPAGMAGSEQPEAGPPGGGGGGLGALLAAMGAPPGGGAPPVPQGAPA